MRSLSDQFIEPEPLTFSEQCEQAAALLVVMVVLFPVFFAIGLWWMA